MGALRLEAVLVGQIVERVLLAVGSGPGDGAAHGQRRVLGADVLQLGLLLARHAVAGLVTVRAGGQDGRIDGLACAIWCRRAGTYANL